MRNRTLVLVVVAVLGVLVALTLFGDRQLGGDLHPQNPDPEGARALAQVLRQQGVEVSVAHDQDELLSARVDTDTTVVVTSTEQLAGSTTSRLERKARTAGTLVIVAPPPEVADDLGGGLQIAGSRSGRAAASCDDPLLDGLTLDVKDSPAYFAPGSERCFPVNDGGLVLDLRVVPQTYVVGAADLLRNERIHEGDNAAAALRLLGQHPRVVWYVPTSADLRGDEGRSVTSLLPDWIAPSLVLLAGATVGLMLWRGRRLGPVVVEPLPVVVRNSEAVEARGWLYRKAGDRRHAATILRASTTRRLADHLALPPGTPPHLLASEVARASGRHPDAVAALLQPSQPADDAALLRLAGDLTDLENDVTNQEVGEA